MSSRTGDAIREARQAAGMEAKDLASAVGVSPQYMCDLELSHRPVPMFRLFRIANVFPDVDSTAWLWLLLTDLWGQPVVDAMRAHAVAEHRRASQEPQP